MKIQFNAPLAVIFGYFLLAVFLVLGAKYIGESIWAVLTALGTCGAVLVALFYQPLRTWYKKPILEIGLYEPEPPHLIRVPVDQSGEKVSNNKEKTIAYILYMKLINTGKSIARSAQPLITNVGSFKDSKWQIQAYWLPLPLLWAFDEWSQKATGKPTEEKDLVPQRPYIFNIGTLSTEKPDTFDLLCHIASKSQTVSYGPGEHCFEVTVYALESQTARKYIRLQWDGGCTRDFVKVKSKIIVSAMDRAPWPHTS